MTDPEPPLSVDPDDLDPGRDEDIEPDLPVEADEADVFDQKRGVPLADEDEYPA